MTSSMFIHYVQLFNARITSERLPELTLNVRVTSERLAEVTLNVRVTSEGLQEVTLNVRFDVFATGFVYV